MKKIVKELIQRKYWKILSFIVLDILALTVCSIFALWLRFDFGIIPVEYLESFGLCLLIDSILMLLIFGYLKLYTSVWSYASIIELLNIICGCILMEILSFGYREIFDFNIPRSYFLIRLLLMTVCICGIRYSYRICRSVYIKFENKFKKKNTMVIGAGSAGRLLIDEILNNQGLFNSKVTCIIDDNKELKGTYLRGVQVVGGRKTIAKNAEKYEIEEIIIAMPSAPKTEISAIVTECQKTKCEIKILPSIYLSMDMKDRNVAKSVRTLNYEDFLGRNQVVVNNEEIVNNIKDKVVLVTGGGGSIGSELCRQIAASNPKTLIIFDIYENNAYDIQQELIRNYPELDLHTIIGSVRDYDRLEKVFEELKPNMVFHAAAHKHVPLMEVSPNEAIKNNCLGTLNACKLADKYKVEKFVLVSTDKRLLLGVDKFNRSLQTLINKGKNEILFN